MCVILITEYIIFVFIVGWKVDDNRRQSCHMFETSSWWKGRCHL